MFTIDQIKAAHSKVKSGADFPNYIQDLIKLGVEKYITYVSDGHTVYFWKDNYKAKSESRYATKPIAAQSNAANFKAGLKEHQEGKTDYAAFCELCAETGVDNWTVDMSEMTCTYYDVAANTLLVEKIPG
ncbi:MAG: DUF1398 family protein [Bacteroidota bacterium]